MIFQCISGLNYFVISIIMIHCVKNVRIRSYSGPHFFAFGLNTERYSASLPHFPAFSRIRTEYGEILRIFTAFFRIRTKYGEILRIFTAFSRIRTEYGSPNAGKCGKNANQNNSECEHFLRSDYLH